MGNLKLQENSIGTQDIFSYDNQNRQIQHIRQRKDGTEHISTSVRYDVNGNVRFETDGNNVTTEKTYDGMNRLKAVTITVSGITQTTTYRYDRNGNLTHETDWRNNTWTNVYDPLNRLTEKWDPYNNCIQKLEYNDNHVQVKSYDALNNITQYEYDMNNRLVKTIDPELNETAQEYDALGNIISKTDGRNNTTRFEYDELNRLVKVINANNEETVYTYDLNGNMLTQTDGKGHTITYEYNCVNLVTRRIDHGGRTDSGYDLSKTESYTYYADGNVKTKTDRNGDTTTYTYDCHGRVKTETIGGSTISYTYDCNGNLLAITDDRGETVRTYDELNRVTSKTVPDIGTVEYEYDIITGAGQGETAERIIDPKGNITVRIYDRAGRLKAVIDGDISSTEKTTYEYYPNGSRKSVIYPNGITEEYTYYPDNTLRTLTNKYSDGTVMDVYTYTYDEANNQVSKHEIINGVEKGTTLYEYDALNRLKKVTEPGGKVTSYTYDRAGNRETETITGNGQTIVNTYEYNEQNRLMTVTTETDGTVTEVTVYTYDNNGNQIKTEVTEYINGIVQEPVIAVTHTYDKRNQLIRTETADGSVITNAYNGEGLRVAKTVNGQTTYFLYEYDKVVLEVCADGAEKARNLYGTNLLMRTVGDESYYYVYNGHADVTALIDKTGNIAATYYYDVFGNILEETGNIDNNITYAGYQYDAETGLYYLNARMYDPKIARFLQEDTYRGDPNDPLSLNLYIYCGNNPIIYWDPTGHWRESDIGLNYEAMAQIVALTNAYYSAKTDYQRSIISKMADEIRADESSYRTEISPVKYEMATELNSIAAAANSVIQRKGRLSKDDWYGIINSAGLGSATSTYFYTREGLEEMVSSTTYGLTKIDINVNYFGHKNNITGEWKPSYDLSDNEGIYINQVLANSDFSLKQAISTLAVLRENEGNISKSELEEIVGYEVWKKAPDTVSWIYQLSQEGIPVSYADYTLLQRSLEEAISVVRLKAISLSMGYGYYDNTPKDPDCRLQNGKWVQTTNPTGFISGGTGSLISISEGTSKINLIQKPNVTNEKLKNIINDLYKGQGGPNTIGNGTTMDAVRNEIKTGLPTNGKFHTQKLNDYLNALQRRLRAGDLNDYDKSVVNALIEDITNALNGK